MPEHHAITARGDVFIKVHIFYMDLSDQLHTRDCCDAQDISEYKLYRRLGEPQ
jgi:hypothetical protein